MKTTSDELEGRLTALLREQADSVPVERRSWSELRATPGDGGPRHRARALVLAAAAVAVVVLAVVVAGPGERTEQVRTGPASEGEPAEPTTTTVVARTPLPYHFETRQVSLGAESLAIDAGGKRFVTAPPVEVRGDPGTPNEYTTLELTWHEHGVEMRLSIYFTSDGREWWSEEIRTYDANDPGDWIYYKGDFFRAPLGKPFVGDVSLTPTDGVGRLEITGLRLEAFRRPAVCDTATGPFAVEPGTAPIVLEGYMSGYGTIVTLLDTASCSVVADQDRYAYEWESRDPSVVAIGQMPVSVPGLTSRRGELTPKAPGHTTVHVVARDPQTGAVVAETDIPVIVGEVTSLPSRTVVQAPPRP